MIKMKAKVHRRDEEDEPQSSSAQIVASITDLLTAIFLRLPIRSLLRFTQVSKQWHSLITNPRFSHLRNLIPNPPSGLFVHCLAYRLRPWIEYVPFSGLKSTKPPLRKLNFATGPIKIVNSCNGLLLCSSFKARDHNRKYYVHNPTTNKFELLPKALNTGKIKGMALAYDPAKSPHYQLVCVHVFGFEIYSSETRSWRKCGDQPSEARVDFENGVYWNGSVHWASKGAEGDSLYFNTNDHTLKVMPAPPVGWECKNNCYYFGESYGHLHYINVIGPSLQFDVYEMRRDYSEWFVKYSVDLSSTFLTAYPEMIRSYIRPMSSCYYAFSIFSVVRGCEKDDEDSTFLVLQVPGKAVRYDIVSRTFETMCEFAGVVHEGGLRYLGTEVFQYIESFGCV